MPGGVLQYLANQNHLLSRAPSVCSTQACQTAARSVLDSIDFNIDPCDDFYQYTCGAWINHTSIPDPFPAIGTLINVSIANVEVLKAVMSGSYEDLLASYDNSSGMLDNAQINEDKANFQKMKTLYSSCINQEEVNKLGPTPVYPYVSKLLSLATNGSYFNLNSTNVMTESLINVLQHGVDSLVNLAVSIDDKESDKHTLTLFQSELTLTADKYKSGSPAVRQFRQGLGPILSRFLGNGTSQEPNPYLQQLQGNHIKPLGSSEIESMVNRFIEFEFKVANITIDDDDLEEPKKTTLSELDQQYPIANWTQIAQYFGPQNISGSDRVDVQAPPFMERLTSWLMSGEVPLQTLQEYFSIKMILSDIPQLDQTTRVLYNTTIANVTGGTLTNSSRENFCVGETRSYFGQLSGRYFVMKAFGGEPQRTKTSHLIDDILSTWIGRLKNNTWLDEETLGRAIEKAQHITSQLAYSIGSLDIRSPVSLSNYYSTFQVKENDYYGNTQSVYNSKYRQQWDRLGKKPNKDNWDGLSEPSELNAFYVPIFNEIIVPAGILQYPLFHAELPEYFTYGGIGSIIGHEISHAFDNNGRLYDSNGFKANWWTNKSSEAFEEKAECFVNQYSNSTAQKFGNETLHVDGLQTLGENLSDNGGIRAAYQALFSKNREQAALPGLEKFSAEQMFFISNARTWCSKSTTAFAINQLETDEHSPDKWRVNLVMQNFEKFSEAFQCQSGRLMNPIKKCNMW
ncbi:hypothetical protein BY458DRAFT_508706 [Sporodiniella umbellata]|nr:hypothetical protein BY458DRAFT_508706 [Sporodiniella umbellata]